MTAPSLSENDLRRVLAFVQADIKQEMEKSPHYLEDLMAYAVDSFLPSRDTKDTAGVQKAYEICRAGFCFKHCPEVFAGIEMLLVELYRLMEGDEHFETIAAQGTYDTADTALAYLHNTIMHDVAAALGLEDEIHYPEDFAAGFNALATFWTELYAQGGQLEAFAGKAELERSEVIETTGDVTRKSVALPDSEICARFRTALHKGLQLIGANTLDSMGGIFMSGLLCDALSEAGAPDEHKEFFREPLHTSWRKSEGCVRYFSPGPGQRCYHWEPATSGIQAPGSARTIEKPAI